jgi:hypothetical protein
VVEMNKKKKKVTKQEDAIEICAAGNCGQEVGRFYKMIEGKKYCHDCFPEVSAMRRVK